MVERVDLRSDRSVYRQIADELRCGIRSGEYMAGDQLPSESRLIDRYRVSRVTVRRALGVLVAEGLVVAEHGRGWFVRSRPPVRRLGSDRFARRGDGKSAFEADMEASNREFTVEVLEVATGAPPEEIAARLGVPAGVRVVLRRRRYLSEGRPIEYATSYIPVEVAEGTAITAANPGPGGIYARREEKGLVLDRYEEEITARMPSEEEADLLGLPGGAPVLHLIRTAVADGHPVEVCDTVMDAAAFVLHYALPARLG